MKLDKFNKRDTRFAPWTALCLLSLIAAMVFALPSVVSAQTVEFSQDCGTALVGTTPHTIRVKVTGFPSPLFPGDRFDFFVFWFDGGGPNAERPHELLDPDENGEFEYTFTSTEVGTDILELRDTWSIPVEDENGQRAIVQTTWTSDAQDPALLACADSSSPPLKIGGWDKLKYRKWGGVTIAICGVGCPDSFNVYDVDLDSVQMAGVSPYRSRLRDSRLCEGGKDGYVDLVLRFKRREVLEAMETLGGELGDGDLVTLDVTGFLKDETPIEGVWEPMIKKIKKRRRWRRY